jgi:hypothetical protein
MADLSLSAVHVNAIHGLVRWQELGETSKLKHATQVGMKEEERRVTAIRVEREIS